MTPALQLFVTAAAAIGLAQPSIPVDIRAVVPRLDDFGIPAPAWVFVALLLLTQFLHTLFMNFVLGGTVVAVVLDLLTLLRRGDHNHLVRIIWQVMPVALSLTITTGVPPLLFVQVLYGSYFYVANVFMGFVWLAVIPVLIAGFYAAYIISYRLSNALTLRLGAWDFSPGRRLLVATLCLAAFAFVGWVLTANHMLTLQPEAWPQDGQWRQNRLMVTPVTTVPRFMHNLGGALAVTGVSIAAIGWWRRARAVDAPEASAAIIRTGLRIALPMIVAAGVFGPIFLFSIPGEVRAGLLRANLYAVAWWVALTGVAAQLWLGWRAWRAPLEFRWFAGLTACMVVTLVGMLCAREQVRLGYLARTTANAFALEQWHVRMQASSLLMFLVMLVVALATVAWLLWICARAARIPASERETHASA